MREKDGYTKKNLTTKGADRARLAARRRSCPSILVLLHMFFYDILGAVLVITIITHEPLLLKVHILNQFLLICGFVSTMIASEIKILLNAFYFGRSFNISICLGNFIRLFSLT